MGYEIVIIRGFMFLKEHIWKKFILSGTRVLMEEVLANDITLFERIVKEETRTSKKRK
jgi:hypothetical protein